MLKRRALILSFATTIYLEKHFRLPWHCWIQSDKIVPIPLMNYVVCGIGFKLIQALVKNRSLENAILYPYLDLVATAIAADIVPMVAENRTLSFFGLEQLRKQPRPGIKTFLETLKKPVTVTDLVFKVAPRINAAGRMDHALKAASLLMSTASEEVNQLAPPIEVFNANPKSDRRTNYKEALLQIEERNEHDYPATVVFHDDWHIGVVGMSLLV